MTRPQTNPREGCNRPAVSPAVTVSTAPAAIPAQSGAFEPHSSGVSVMAASSVMGATAPVEAPAYLERASWPHRLTSALSVLPRLRLALARLVRAGNATQAASGAAMPTQPMERPTEPQLSASEARLRTRAIRVCNRSPKAVAQYLATHRALRAAYSEVPE